MFSRKGGPIYLPHRPRTYLGVTVKGVCSVQVKPIFQMGGRGTVGTGFPKASGDGPRNAAGSQDPAGTVLAMRLWVHINFLNILTRDGRGQEALDMRIIWSIQALINQ